MGPAIPDSIHIIYGAAFACALAYFGMFFYATVDFITTLFNIALFAKKEKIEEKVNGTL